MHPCTNPQVNGRYHPQATRCCQVQLNHAIHAALHTKGPVATYWVEEAERLAGRIAIAIAIAIAQAGGTFRSAIHLVPMEVRRYLQLDDTVEPSREPRTFTKESTMFDPETVPCEICGSASSPIDKRCDGCWEVEHHLASYIKSPCGSPRRSESRPRLRTTRPRAGLLPVDRRRLPRGPRRSGSPPKTSFGRCSGMPPTSESCWPKAEIGEATMPLLQSHPHLREHQGARRCPATVRLHAPRQKPCPRC